MNDTPRTLADRRYKEALERTGARDLKDSCRERLLVLRDRSRETFDTARAYFDDRVVPAIVAEGSDPIAEWVDYSRYLATLIAEGDTVQIDATGLSRPYSLPAHHDHLVLHLPRSSRETALVVGWPLEMSTAQTAVHELLVLRKTS